MWCICQGPCYAELTWSARPGPGGYVPMCIVALERVIIIIINSTPVTTIVAFLRLRGRNGAGATGASFLGRDLSAGDTKLLHVDVTC